MLKIFYTWIIILFVPLSLYKVNILTFTLADAFLITFILIYLINVILVKKENKMFINKHLLLISGGIIFHALLIILISQLGIQSEMLLRTLRFVFYLLFIALFVREFFDFNLGLKILKVTSIISSILLIIQFVLLHFANYYLSVYIPGLPLAAESLNELGKNYALGYAKRPNSIFQEPAHFASYVLLYFGITLFSNYKKEKMIIILLGVSLILAGSSTGILLALGLVFLWLLKLLKELHSTQKVLNFMLILTFVAIFSLVFSKTQIFVNFVDRTFENGSATEGRFGNYSDIFLEKTSTVDKIIGHGMVRYDDYIPGIPRIYYYFGIIGLSVFIFYGLFNMLKKPGYQKITLLLLLISSLGTEIILGKFIILYLPFIVGKIKQ